MHDTDDDSGPETPLDPVPSKSEVDYVGRLVLVLTLEAGGGRLVTMEADDDARGLLDFLRAACGDYVGLQPSPPTPAIRETVARLRRATEVINLFWIHHLLVPDDRILEATGADLIATALATVSLFDAIDRGGPLWVIQAAWARMDRLFERGFGEADEGEFPDLNPGPEEGGTS